MLKIKHTTLINEYQDGGLKNVDIDAKIRSLQPGWVRRLFVDNYHPWKIIPLNVLKKFGGENIFHRNVDIDLKKLPATLPKFYSGLIQTWCETMAYDPADIAKVLSEHLWYNRHHKISNKPFTTLSVRVCGHKSCSRFIYRLASDSLAFCQIKVQPG